jgi:hypothetical protein
MNMNLAPKACDVWWNPVIFMMIIRASHQVPRTTLMSRLPVPRSFLPRNLAVGSESRIERGQIWLAPAGAKRVKTFEVYRYDPDSGRNPRIDTFAVDLDDCGPMEKSIAAKSLSVARHPTHVGGEFGWHRLQSPLNLWATIGPGET